jgi:hypothetical protein
MKEDILDKSFKKAINGGSAGFMAMTGQVFGLMWMRTMINHQYRHGGTLSSTFRTLYKEGGIPRFYRGIGFALMQAPISRFGDTAMNIGMMELLKDSDMNTATKTFAGSCGAGLWRMSIMPLDTLKSSMQVNGNEGMNVIKGRIRKQGMRTMYNGALASGTATMIGHFPWFLTYNKLQEIIPKIDKYTTIDRYDRKQETEFYNTKKILRSGFIGFCSSSISDISSNAFRVVKVNRQTQSSNLNYTQLVKNIIEKEGINGLFTRGLKTKIVANGIQGMLFTIIFDYLRNN